MRCVKKTRKLTNLDISPSIEKNIIGLDVTMNDVLTMEMGKTFASLQAGQQSLKWYRDDRQHTSLQMVEICASVI